MATAKPLTDTLIKSLKPSSTPIKKYDGYGLYIEVSPKGKKVWRFKSKLKTKKEILMTIGEYPIVSLKKARQRREAFREMIADGKDPRQVIADEIRAEQERISNTFSAVSLEWLENKKKTISSAYAKQIERRLETYVFPAIGNIPVSDLTPRQVISLVKEIEKTSSSSARLCKAEITRICSYAVQMNLVERNPAYGLMDVLTPKRVTHYASIKPSELPEFVRALGKCKDKAAPVTHSAITLLLMLFPRKTELVHAKWSEINLDDATWVIPWDRMKMGRKVKNPNMTDHVIPLPHQAVEVLRDLYKWSGWGMYVFGSVRHGKEIPLGKTSLKNILDRMGYEGKMTVHGFRSLAASWLDEQGYDRRAIEKQLAHVESGFVNQAYHRSDYLEERREMLQAWADHIDSLKD